MIIIVFFVLLVFLYSLVSRQLEHTVVTTPIVFTSAGILLILAMPGSQVLDVQRASLLKLAELGLVMLLFTDATHINLKTLRSREKLPLRLLIIVMLLTILLGAIAAHFIFPQLLIWETGVLAPILSPTDEVIVRSPRRLPQRIRQSLDIEQGSTMGFHSHLSHVFHRSVPDRHRGGRPSPTKLCFLTIGDGRVGVAFRGADWWSAHSHSQTERVDG